MFTLCAGLCPELVTIRSGIIESVTNVSDALLLRRNLPYPTARLAAQTNTAVNHGFYIKRCDRCIADKVLTCWQFGPIGELKVRRWY